MKGVDARAPNRWPGIGWLDSFPLAAMLAQRSRRPILVGVFDAATPGSAAMERAIHSDPELVRFIGERFVPVRADRSEGLEPALGRLVPWTPAILHLDPDGRPFRRAIGVLPPAALRAELRIALGLRALLADRDSEALAWFERAAEPVSTLAAEALYWAGVAAHRGAPENGTLRERWDTLRARYPGSPWSERADIDLPVPPPREPSAKGSWAEAWRTVRRTIAMEWRL